MSLDAALEAYPKTLRLTPSLKPEVRPLERDDEDAFHRFFLAVPDTERMFIKHRVTDRNVIRSWCENIDLTRNLPLLAFADGQIVGAATLHQQHGGWKRHIGRVSVLVHPAYRGRGLARNLVTELLELASASGLERVEAEFIGEQVAAMKVFATLGFSVLLRIQDYVKDMQANPHDYVLMGYELLTDEEYAGVG